MSRLGMLVDLKRCAGCGACVVACQLWNNQKPGVSWVKLDVREWGREPGSSSRAFVPRACMHCPDAPCVAVCPTGASKQLEDGAVVVDYDGCISCQLCVTACPYGARVVSQGGENYFEAIEQAPYEAYGTQRGDAVEKCTFCHDRVENDEQPACVVNCPVQARYFGDLDDPESDVSKRLAWGDAVQVDGTSFYYTLVEGMSQDLLPLASNMK